MAGRHHSQNPFESTECYIQLLVHAAGIEDLTETSYQLMAALLKIIPLSMAAAEDKQPPSAALTDVASDSVNQL